MADDPQVIERVQTGVRMEKRLLKVLRAFADFNDLSLGDLLEGIVLHAFDGKCPFNKNSLKRIQHLKNFYGLDLDSRASHKLTENLGLSVPKRHRPPDEPTVRVRKDKRNNSNRKRETIHD